ncbi:MAG: ATPase [Planctomycetes bacterium]|nr:ATPase [Planctomycetota bacterium]
MAIIGSVFCTNAFAEASSDDGSVTTDAKLTSVEVEGLKFALIAASVAFGLGAIGAGIAISHVGAAAMGAIAEKPQIAGQALIFVALAEGIVVFGFITALMILGKV